MHIISYKKIKVFCDKHPNATNSLNHWYKIVKCENLKMFADIKKLFSSADQVGNFVVFNIGGNKFRLVAFLRYGKGRLFIRHILTHTEYDRGKWKEDEWFKNINI